MENKPDTFVYVGKEALENIEEAVNYNRALTELVCRTRTLRPESAVLDFGAGIGTFARALRARGLSPECLEIDAGEAKLLSADGFATYTDLNTVPDGRFELIYSLNVFEHIEDDAGVLKELSKKLTPGGSLFIFVPAFQVLYSDFDASVGHFRRYHKDSLERIVRGAGLSVKELRYFDTLGFLAAYVFKVLGMKPDGVTKGKIRFFDRVIFPLDRIFDPLLRPWFGKNVYVTCRKEE